VLNLPKGKLICNQTGRISLVQGASRFLALCGLVLALAGVGSPANANQQYEPMADHLRLALRTALNAPVAPRPIFDSVGHRIHWMAEMSRRLSRRVPDFNERTELIKTIRYEAQRVGIDPQVIFALIEVESNFRADAVSHAGAIGLMQVMPFWTKVLSNGNVKQLYEPRVNIRYGCLILRHYLDMENGNFDRAFGRYNGSLGKMTYPNLIYDRLDRNWGYYYVEPPKPIPRTALNDIQVDKR
jgi:soluble lytic murein transglycosylase-like protein